MQQFKRLPALAVLCAAAAVAADTPTSGTLNVLSMNVAGLPAILQGNGVPGDKETNTKLIGTRFSQLPLDVIHVQEDFNYHAALYSTDTHPFRTATSGGVPFGSGLNTLSSLDWINFTRTKWATCSDASSNDCLTPKGFTFMRVILAPGSSSPANGWSNATTAVYADFYNLHADAGTETDDERARNANIQQVADAIAAQSAGHAVFVFGDTNSRYSRTLDTAIRGLLTPASAGGPGLTDAWVQLQRGGVVPTQESLCTNPSSTSFCEVVDKVFYRSSPLVDVAATSFRYDGLSFLQPDGNILSDHDPAAVNFTWSTQRAKLRQSPYFGGPHGDYYSDVPALAAAASAPRPTAINLRGASRLDSIGLTLADGTTFTHGGTGGNAASLALAAGEAWVETKMCSGQKGGLTRVFYVQATTSAGRTVSAGTDTGDCATYEAPEGWAVVGFSGRDGDEVDQLSLVYGPR